MTVKKKGKKAADAAKGGKGKGGKNAKRPVTPKVKKPRFRCINSTSGCKYKDADTVQLAKHEQWFCKFAPERWCMECNKSIKRVKWFDHCIKKHKVEKKCKKQLKMKNLEKKKLYRAILRAFGSKFFINWQADLTPRVMNVNIISNLPKKKTNKYKCKLKVTGDDAGSSASREMTKITYVPEDTPYVDFSALSDFNDEKVFEDRTYSVLMKMVKNKKKKGEGEAGEGDTKGGKKKKKKGKDDKSKKGKKGKKK